MRGVSAVILLVILAMLACVGCGGSIGDDLRSAQANYDEARYENASVWLDEVATREDSLSSAQRARFYFLRGMTAYRLDQRDEALYFLKLTEAAAGEEQVGLTGPQTEAMRRALADLTPSTATHHARPPGML